MRSAVRICLAAPEILENFGFRGFFCCHVACVHYAAAGRLLIPTIVHICIRYAPQKACLTPEEPESARNRKPFCSVRFFAAFGGN